MQLAPIPFGIARAETVKTSDSPLASLLPSSELTIGLLPGGRTLAVKLQASRVLTAWVAWLSVTLLILGCWLPSPVRLLLRLRQVRHP